ncbi:hypothetical protein BV25DRAFT_530230 [Artomyces pyxidatus]|uniref:Uncharacterized protein n=1 Tax=Artomyces pyxidatus TaxID=48021 RepID=A0ACB8TIE9_9AGAM|nr:hypothetical protein BV25DRAFT_530230 [Artomyces pyxidatus]
MATISRNVLEEELRSLLEKPFGPYLDEMILSPKCRSTEKSVLCLEALWLECGGQCVGYVRPLRLAPFVSNHLPYGSFDQTELHPVGTVPLAVRDKPLPKNAPVRFRGVLTIHNLAHLTEEGLQHLEEDFKHEHTHGQISGKIRHRLNHTPTIRSLYDRNGKGKEDGLRVKVWVQGIKNMTVGYMTSRLAPKGLLLNTKHTGRSFEVLSLDDEVYTLSRTYLLRYRTLHTLYQIAKLDDALPKGERTPVLARTPLWFTERYFAQLAYSARPLRRRVEYLHDAPRTSGDEGSGYDSLDEVHTFGLRTRRLRFPRTVHTAEILSKFASHAEWIVADHAQLQTQRRWLALDAWRAWLPEVERARARAKRKNPLSLWGMRDEHTGDVPSRGPSEPRDEMEVCRNIAEPPARPNSKRRRTFLSPSEEDEPAVQFPAAPLLPKKAGKKSASKAACRGVPPIPPPPPVSHKGKGKLRTPSTVELESSDDERTPARAPMPTRPQASKRPSTAAVHSAKPARGRRKTAKSVSSVVVHVLK